ncbi:MAG TPA: DUF5615 family PIN-like protein [Fimbriimonadaceae bacterium]|nr:DUF5615 family PIN-like protein [Fimbriimonadaceae bacterium]
MKLLFDENLSPKLPVLLADVYPASTSVFDAGLGGSPDGEVLNFAAQNGFVIVSKDRDFLDMILQSCNSARLIWIRLGNSSTAAVHLLLRNQVDRVTRFGKSTDLILEIP